MSYKIRFAKPEEEHAIRAYRKHDYVVDEFQAIWSRWKNWESYPPVVILSDDELIAFHGYTESKFGYVNSIAQWIRADHRGRRLGGKMVEFILRKSHKQRLRRLKFKTPHDVSSSGYLFWSGFGLIPIGHTDKEFYFDLDIEDVDSLDLMIAYADELCADVTTDKRTLSWYKRAGVIYTHPDWKHLNAN